MGRLGHWRLRVGRRWDAQGGQDWETGSPDWTFKEAKIPLWAGIRGQEVHSGQDQGLWMFVVSKIRRQKAQRRQETEGSQWKGSRF